MRSRRRPALAGISTRTAFLCLGILLGWAGGAWAQTSTVGTVAGVVNDESNAAIPAAEVKITETATNNTLSTVTNAEGRYVFSAVPPGMYSVSFGKQGFNSYVVNAQHVQIGQSLTINATLKVGSTATTVQVTAEAGAGLQTMNATVGNTLNGESLLLLPNLGRDVTSMAVLQPATTPTGFTAGSYQDANTYQLDGANITDDMGGNTIGYQTNYSGLGGSQGGSIPSGVIPTPIESIEEFKVSVANQTSDFNNSDGAQIQMATKRGSNQFHGTGYLFYYDNAIGQANSWANNHTPLTFGALTLPDTPVDFPKNHRTRFGTSIGGPLTPKPFLGGKWYFFFNFEGLRFPNVQLFNKSVPSELLRAGIIQVPNAQGVYQAYNLNPGAVTVNGITYQPAMCPAGACDPRGIGLNPVVNEIWQKEMPLPNNPLGGDNYNTQGYLGSIAEPLTSNNYVGRIDHDFSDKWHFYLTYRDFKLVSLTGNQTDVGGVLTKAPLGTPVATAPRPQQPSVWTAGMTTTINPTTTNSFVFSYLRQFWQWSSDNGPAQLPGLGGALEIGGESSSALIPYNVNTQSVRQRFWDGQDKLIRDDLTMLKGNHLFAFGGAYQRNFDYHSRTDNGAGVNDQVSYLSTSSGFNWTSPVNYIPTSVPSSQYSTWETEYAYVLGMLSSTQVMYTRSVPGLNLEAVGTPATDKDIIPYYSVYFDDTWHVKPTFTFNYGLGWNLEMPPYELNGSQVEMVDANNQPIVATDFLAQREAAALQGSSYTPQVGFTLVRGVGAGLKYPYDPYYGEFSPRASLAWNPHYTDGLLGKIFGTGKSVVRGGYSRIFGRLNGVDLVLVPLLGPGLLQGVTCVNPLMNGSCAGSGVATPANAFRIGTDGLTAPLAAASNTLPQPFYPGVGANPETVDPDSLDPHFKPDRTDNFTITLQREINQHMSLEVGYIGKIIKNEYMLMNLDAVPYMTTLGGESFAQAYAQVYQQMFFNGVAATNVTVQPFFEAALGGASSGFCKGYTSCTAAVASNYGSLIKEAAVSDVWNKLNAAQGWILGRTVFSQPVPGGTVGQSTSLGSNTSLGWGNYNGLFVSYRTNTWHGVTAVSNFTWGRSLGTSQLAQYNSSSTPLTPYDLGANYGPQNFDIKFIYNLSMYWAPPFFRGQHGVLGHLLGGWNISPLFTAQSGGPTGVSYSEGSCTGCEAFGEVTTPGTSAVGSTSENAVGYLPYTGGMQARYNITGDTGTNVIFGTNSVGTKSSSPYLLGFANPGLVYSEFRPCVLGFDTSCGGYYNLRGMPTWDLDTTIVKDVGVYKERVGAMLFFTFTNIMNHFQPSNPSLSLTSPTSFGQITGGGSPRSLEMGLRLHF
ncbi:MAG TPA: carboxypeptidase-like regulatory domain-containing protein [Bryobacteraceae bacterium]|nr:carboxypeptidase-like regulatory domain-containing protein [Bryobacteraceae bacterium]